MVLKYLFVLFLGFSFFLKVNASAAREDYEQKTHPSSSSQRSISPSDIEKILKEQGLKGLYKWQQEVLQNFSNIVTLYGGIPQNIHQLVPWFKHLYPLYELGRLHLGNLHPYVRRCLFDTFNRDRSTLATQGCQINWMSDYSPNIPEKVGIIGGGYTGAMTALLLSKLRDRDGQRLYEVHLYERNKNLMEGASFMPGRLHLGGEYPKDPETAQECLLSAIIFRQMFQDPEAYTTIPGVSYLLSQSTPVQSLTLKQMKDNYQNLQKIYRNFYHKRFKNEYGESTDNLFFGSPQSLFQEVTTAENQIFYVDETGCAHTQIVNPSVDGFQMELTSNNLAVKGFQGGIYAHEKGLHPIYLGAILEYFLEQEGVHIHCNVGKGQLVHQGSNFTEKKGEKNPVKYYTLEGGETTTLDHIVNATWTEFKIFEHMCVERVILAKQSSEVQQVYHRAILLADISRCIIPQVGTEQTAFFGQLDHGGGMVSPFNNKLALFYWPSVEGSWMGETVLSDSSSFVLKREIHDPFKELDEEHRKHNIIKALGEKYPAYKDARPVQLITRETLNSSEVLTKRRHIKALRPLENVSGWAGLETGKRDYTRALSSKATYTSVTALQAARTVLKGSAERGYVRKIDSNLYKWLEDFYVKGITLETAILPEIFRFKSNLPLDELRRRAIQYCYSRQLPKEMCE